jgi:hypothetical protein
MNPVLGEKTGTKIPISRSVIVSDDESCGSADTVRVGYCCECARVELFSLEYTREKGRGKVMQFYTPPGVGMIRQND